MTTGGEARQVVSNVLVAPLAELLTEFGKAIVENQRALDEYSAAVQAELEEQDAPFAAPWFAMPDVTLELKLSLEYHQVEVEGRPVPFRRLLAIPPSPKTVTEGFQIEGTSTISIRLVAAAPRA